MEKKTVNIINFENVETVYQRRLRTLTVKVRGIYTAVPEMNLQTINRPFDLKEVLDTIFGTLDDDQEHLVLLILNAGNELAGYKVIASGGQDHIPIDPRIVFRNALLLGAAKIMLAHNHPTGRTIPSEHDLEMTKRIAFIGEKLHLELLDHVIWTKKEIASIRQHSPDCFKP